MLDDCVDQDLLILLRGPKVEADDFIEIF